MWIAKLIFWSKADWQIPHLKGFSPVWINLCLVKLQAYENLVGQESHLNNFWLVWDFPWVFNAIFVLKERWQTSHLNGLSSEWVFLWFLKLLNWGKVIWQISQVKAKGFSSVWVFCALQESIFAWILLNRGHIRMVFRQCDSFCVAPGLFPRWMQMGMNHIWMAFH